MDREALERLRDDPIDWRYKGFPPAEGVTPRTVATRGWGVLSRDLMLPALVLRETALAHNLALMRRWCAEHGVSLAPHGKTTMSPELVARQLDAGAWAITAATPSQVRVFRAFGVDRIVLANELVEPGSVRWVADELARDAGFEFACLVDSVAAVEAMAAALPVPPARPIPVLVELGLAGGRTGARTAATARAVARAVLRAPALELAGVEGYEGIVHDDDPAVDAFLVELRRLLVELAGEGVFDHREEVLVSAGGSVFFDRVAALLAPPLDGLPLRVVIRSGCYLTHDDGMYDRLSPLGARSTGERLRPALEAWGVVLSRPERELALVGMGKRDVPTDAGLPAPLHAYGAEALRDVRGAMTVVDTNDQHAYVRVPPDDPLAVGDLLGCGISHPCTAFDKWRLLPVVDDELTVVDAVHTYF